MFYSAPLGTQSIILIVLVVVLVAVLIIMPFFTNKKNKKTVEELHSSLKPGCKVMTIGGIVGTVLAVRETSPVDKEIIIETGDGDNKSTITLDVKGIYQVIPNSIPVDNSVAKQTTPPEEDVFDDSSKTDAIIEDKTTANDAKEEVGAIDAVTVSVKEEVSTVDAAAFVKEEVSTVDAATDDAKTKEEVVKVDAKASSESTKTPISSTTKTSAAKSTTAKTSAPKATTTTKSTTAKKTTSTKK